MFKIPKNCQLLLSLFSILISLPVYSQNDIGEQIASIQKEIEEIRGEKFRHNINYAIQSQDDFAVYLDNNLDAQYSDSQSSTYDKVIRILGLYRGEEITDFKSMAKMIMQTQAGAYYDPDVNTFYVVMPDLPEQALNSIYAHELYHGFQDQYFDLNNYILEQSRDNKLNDDQLMARQAVVEGEATYLMTLWQTKSMLGSVPSSGMLKMAIDMQANLTTEQLFELTKLSLQSNMTSVDSARTAADAMENIPGFIIDNMVGAYMKGMRFVFEIHQDDWSNVSKLYEDPPVSTEQILHPEKWTDGEVPYQYTWPDFQNNDELTDWQLLEQNTLGEMQWRSVFTEYEMANISSAAAAGWDGDSYRVMESPDRQNTVLMMITSWDSEQEATEFRNAYAILSTMKYQDKKGACRHLKQDGADVYIMESMRQVECGGFIDLLNQVEKRK